MPGPPLPGPTRVSIEEKKVDRAREDLLRVSDFRPHRAKTGRRVPGPQEGEVPLCAISAERARRLQNDRLAAGVGPGDPRSLLSGVSDRSEGRSVSRAALPESAWLRRRESRGSRSGCARLQQCPAAVTGKSRPPGLRRPRRTRPWLPGRRARRLCATAASRSSDRRRTSLPKPASRHSTSRRPARQGARSRCSPRSPPSAPRIPSGPTRTGQCTIPGTREREVATTGRQ